MKIQFGPAMGRRGACVAWMLAAGLCGIAGVRGQYPSAPQITNNGTAIILQDYASLPISTSTTSGYPPATNYATSLSRVNFLRSEPTNAPLSSTRFFVNDLNRNFYILNRTSKVFSVYINFEEVFPKFDNNPGYAGGLVTFAFDPEYATNHKFYTVHTEEPGRPGSAAPTNGTLPGFNITGYTLTAAINPPAGPVGREAVLVEWTDTNINNTTFEGTARELLRIGFLYVVHPMGDLLFNPLAHTGDPDYRNLYIANGDGGAGESNGVTHPIPQRLDALQGKVLRITPDTNLHTGDILSDNGRYRIPSTGTDTNPFVSITLTNARKEIYAYGFRNPHRFTWDPDSNKLISNDIGLYSWEEVNIIHKGANYGWAEREGIEQLFVGGANDGKTGSQTSPVTPFPSPDLLTVTGLVSTVTPTYPVAEYSHHDGDAISSGFVYRGSLMPFLRGKYVFGDITTARLFVSDLAEMIATDDGVRTNVAPISELQVVFNGVKRRMWDVITNSYRAKGGTASGAALPGGCGGLVTGGNDPYGVPYGCGRADIRLAQDSDNELYVLSKSDGMIRKVIGQAAPPLLQLPKRTNGTVTLNWSAISNVQYRVQYRTSLINTSWTDVSGDVTATNSIGTKTNAAIPGTKLYRVRVLP